MSTEEARLLVNHHSPCDELDRARNNIDRLFGKVDHPETGLGALNRGLNNSVEWQARVEARVNQMYYLIVAAAFSGFGSLVIGVALLLMGKGK